MLSDWTLKLGFVAACKELKSFLTIVVEFALCSKALAPRCQIIKRTACELMNEIQGQIATVHSGIAETMDDIGSRVSAVNQDSERYKQLRAQISERLATLTKYSDQMKAKNKALMDQIDAFNADVDNTKRELKAKKQALRQELECIESNVASNRTRIESSIEQISKEKEQYESLEKQETEVETQLDALQGRVNSLLEMQVYVPTAEVEHERENIEQTKEETENVMERIETLNSRKRMLSAVPTLQQKAMEDQKRTEEINEMFDEVEKKKASQMDAIQSKSEMLDAVQAELDAVQKLRVVKDEIESQKLEVAKERETIDNESEQVEKEVTVLEDSVKEIVGEIATCDNEGEEIEARAAELDAQIHEIDTDPVYAMYANMETELEQLLANIVQEGEIEEQLKEDAHKFDDELVIDETQLVSEEDRQLMKEPEIHINHSISLANTGSSDLRVQIENLLRVINVLTAEQMRLEHDLHHQHKKKKHYLRLLDEFHAQNPKSHKSKLKSTLRAIRSSKHKIKENITARQMAIASKQSQLDQIFAARRFRSVTATGEDAELESLSIMLDSRILSWKLVCESLSWCHELFTIQANRLTTAPHPLQLLKQWHVSLDSIYPRSDDLLIRACCYLIE